MEVTENVFWVGVVDWALRFFHGYTVPDGATYNAYLVKIDDKTILIDTVK